jgi:dUTP pyrophosphatase
MKIQISKLPDVDFAGISLPAYVGDAGMDLAAVKRTEIPAHGYIDVPHGFCIEIPLGYFGYILPRSSLIKRENGNMVVMASPIDAGYRGQIFTMVRNNGDHPLIIDMGQRVSQMVILPHATIDGFVWSTYLPESNRGPNGFGSTGR